MNDRAHGAGIYNCKDGTKYDGGWFCDVQHGYGKEEWADGSKYEGTFRAGKKHGKGIFLLKISKYITSLISVIGTYNWPDGSVYSGSWKDNAINGFVRLDMS